MDNNAMTTQAAEPLGSIQRADALLRARLDHFPDAVAEADLITGKLTYLNRMFTILTRYSAEDLAAGIPALELFDTGSQSRIIEKIQRELTTNPREPYQRTGRQEFVPVRCRRRDGSWFAAEVHGSYVLGENERPTGLCFVLRDIEDSISLKRLLDLTRARWESLQQLSPVGIFHMSRDGRITEVNRRMTTVTGMRAEELLGWGFLNPIHPTDRDWAAKTVRQAIASPDPSAAFKLECRMNAEGGTARWMRVECLGQEDESGSYIGFLGTLTEITEQKQMEARLSAELQGTTDLVELILERTPAAIVVIDSSGRFVRANPAAVAISGFAEADLLTMSISHYENHARAAAGSALIPRILAGEPMEPTLIAIDAADGSTRRGEMTAAPVRGAEGESYSVITFLDLTERLSAEAMLAQAQKMESVGRLASGIAHDFNNVLSVIGGCAELAAGEIPVGHPSREDLDQIKDAVGRGSNLTRQLLAFSRSQAIHPRVVDVNESIRASMWMLERLLGNEIQLRLRLDREPCHACIDPTQLDQVLFNLAANAHDAMEGGGHFTITTSLRGTPGGPESYVRIEVSDNGPGMDEATRRRAFEPFFTTKTAGKGTGLGLATSYGIVTQADGEIAIESEPGAGTVVRITLPAAQPEE